MNPLLLIILNGMLISAQNFNKNEQMQVENVIENKKTTNSPHIGEYLKPNVSSNSPLEGERKPPLPLNSPHNVGDKPPTPTNAPPKDGSNTTQGDKKLPPSSNLPPSQGDKPPSSPNPPSKEGSNTTQTTTEPATTPKAPVTKFNTHAICNKSFPFQ